MASRCQVLGSKFEVWISEIRFQRLGVSFRHRAFDFLGKLRVNFGPTGVTFWPTGVDFGRLRVDAGSRFWASECQLGAFLS